MSLIRLGNASISIDTRSTDALGDLLTYRGRRVLTEPEIAYRRSRGAFSIVPASLAPVTEQIRKDRNSRSVATTATHQISPSFFNVARKLRRAWRSAELVSVCSRPRI
jgi:hypothetical protein